MDEEETEEKVEKSKYWYPAFKLRSNPFKFFESRIEDEKDVDFIPFIETSMHRKVKALVDAGISCIIRGERGCGKTSLIYGLSMVEEMMIPDVTAVKSPNNIDDFYSQIYSGVDDEITARMVATLWGKYPTKAVSMEEEACKLCPSRCRVKFYTGTPHHEIYADHIRMAQGPCRAREKIVHRILQEHELCDKTILLDNPDNLTRKDLMTFVFICQLLLQSGNTLIIFVTPQQAETLRKKDTFARLPIVDFERPSKEFFKELFMQRVNFLGRQGEDEASPPPFKEEVVEKLIECSNYTPRVFIQLCSQVLTEMWLRNMTEPCNLSFLDVLGIQPAISVTEQDKLLQVLERHKGEWVGIQQLTAEISEAMGASFTEKKVGSILRKLGFTMRKLDAAGKAQVLITPSTLETHLKKQSSESSESPEP